MQCFDCNVQQDVCQRWSRGHNVRGQGLKKKKSDAKANDRLFEERPSRGQGQVEWSTPRTKDTTFLYYGWQIFHNFQTQKCLRCYISLSF